MKRAAIVAASSVVFVFVGGASGLTATNPDPPADDDEPSLSGTSLQRAEAVALAVTGGGEVTASEVGDEQSFYEVEVTLPDGRQVDVQLDESFDVVNRTPDGRDGDTG